MYDYEDLMNDGSVCSHLQFENNGEVTPIQDLERYKGKNISTCCEAHAYVFHDNCKVRIKKNINLFEKKKPLFIL